jgi:ribonuclease HIII
MAEIFVTNLPEERVGQLKVDLLEKEFELSSPEHTFFQARKPGICCTLYKSLKLTVSGKKMQEFIEFYLEPEILHSVEFTARKELREESVDKRARIGVDEAGKGDYFGPLCVAGVMADSSTIPYLLELGVKDSKKLSDPTICQLAKKIVLKVPNYIIRLRPEKYNELYSQFGNLNSLLAWCHASVITSLSSQTAAQVAIIDKFAHEAVVEKALRKKKSTIMLEQRVRGEEDVVVAAASIVARWAFLEGLKQTGELYHEELPKGAGSVVVEKARKFLQKHGKEALSFVAKIHFKTTKEVCNFNFS